MNGWPRRTAWRELFDRVLACNKTALSASATTGSFVTAVSALAPVGFYRIFYRTGRNRVVHDITTRRTKSDTPRSEVIS